MSSDRRIEGSLTDEEYARRRRLRDIFESRKHVREIRVQLPNVHHPNQAKDRAKMFAQAAKGYLDEVLPLIHTYEEQAAPYWTDYSLGVMYVDPPEELEQRATEDIEPKKFTFDGLRDFVHVPAQQRYEFEVEIFDDIHGKEVVTEHTREPISPEVTEGAVRAINLFLSDIGIGIKSDQGLPTIRDFDQSGAANDGGDIEHFDDGGAPEI